MKKLNDFSSIVILIFLFYCFIFSVLLPVGNILSKQASGTWGDIFSLGQFLADLCLIPFAIVAFYLTLHELRKTRERADLYIGWEESNKAEYTFSIHRDGLVSYNTEPIYLENKGTTPVSLYQITLEIPTEYGVVRMENTIGDWTGSNQRENHKFNLLGTPHLTIFPKGSPIDLGKIVFTTPKSLPEKIVIKYYIASEKSEYKTGKLSINLNELKKDGN